MGGSGRGGSGRGGNEARPSKHPSSTVTRTPQRTPTHTRTHKQFHGYASPAHTHKENSGRPQFILHISLT